MNPTETSVFLVRHTRVEAPGLCYGQTDAVPLAATFSAEAEAVRAALLAALEPLLVAAESAGIPLYLVSSPAARCRVLAAFLAETLPEVLPANAKTALLPPDPRLHELHFGTWENRPWAELPPTELDPWMANFVTAAPPGGESFLDLAARAGAWRTAVARHAPAVIIAVTHAGLIRALRCQHAAVPLANAFEEFADVPYGTVVAV